MSLCCGGSLGNLTLSSGKRAAIASDAAKILTSSAPDELITACPLCKKTLGQATVTKVADIAELVAAALPKPKPKTRVRARKNLVRAHDNG
jgi:Fe-S oxidoreductase